MHAAAVILGVMMAMGCGGPAGPQQRAIVYDYDPLLVVERCLEGYVGGVPVGSERDNFDTWMKKLQATDPETARWLGEGLHEIAASPDQAAGVAARLLAKLHKKPVAVDVNAL